MARYRRGRMALYEVMSKAKGKPGYLRTLKSMRVEKAAEEGPSTESTETEKNASAVTEATVDASPAVVSDGAVAAEPERPAEKSNLYVKWRRKPSVVQYNHGRVEFSVPYQLGIAVLLGLVVIMLLAFRAGQRWASVESVGVESGRPPDSGSNRQTPVVDRNKSVRQESPAPVERKSPESGNAGTAVTTGANAIVLVQYRSDRDLAPVRAHFASYGIATEIVKSGGQYFLITQDRYNSFAPGGDGQLAKQKIADVGAEYKGKAPEGYETFAPHYFSDAYPKKVN
ncbi:MAG TPA: hypothetical protein VJJ98_07640 [Sedimentisphaerales bacterium]|nr:hypothetical protein [Sedimentisphaerales bacterium]